MSIYNSDKPDQGMNRGIELRSIGMKHDVFSSETGEITVRWPMSILPSDKADLLVWLERIQHEERTANHDP